ncbi:hypothetical protein IAE22_30135 [Bacillus sp. S34]|nr:hypothetical protein [Bacillus sp. S34]
MALVAVALTTILAERSLGSLRTLVSGVAAPALAVLGTLATVSIGAAFGEAHAEFAVGQPLFAPSIVACMRRALLSVISPIRVKSPAAHASSMSPTVSVVEVTQAG